MSLHGTTSRADALCTRCATIPGMNTFQPIVASTVEVCHAAENLAANAHHNHRARMKKLATSAVDETERAVNGMEMMPLPLSEDTVRILERVKGKLDDIRRAIEQMHTRSKGKLLKDSTVDRETRCLEKKLKALVDALLKGIHKPSGAEGISPGELANFTIRAASAVCEAPVLNFLKPVAGIAEIIAETAQTVKSNRSAALQLAAHSSMVTKAIAEHAATLGLDGFPAHSEALVALKSVLSDIHLYLTDLQKPRQRRITSWIMAKKKKDRIQELNQGLDKALTLFTTTKVLSTHTEVREIATLVRASSSVEEIATQVRLNTDVLTTVQADLATVLVTISASTSVVSNSSLIKSEGENWAKKPHTTALVPSLSDVAQLTLFFFFRFRQLAAVYLLSRRSGAIL
ncbi:hypothetical protein MSAN_00342700 [Mycena sanguinolenta]|uniref:Uncharacterized protein n=1 Tax=Mycena sanguinolenta TaxID=230812 RepID=A0A8H6ZCW6_9AGAR|nr:hypothetical protein MSAN_00342700 [Mycena sanguinolenta]